MRPMYVPEPNLSTASGTIDRAPGSIQQKPDRCYGRVFCYLSLVEAPPANVYWVKGQEKGEFV